MIRKLQKILFFDRSLLALSIAIIVIALTVIIAFIYTGTLDKKNTTLRSSVDELRSMTGGVTALKRAVDLKVKKIGLTRTGGIVPVLEQMLNSLDIKAKAIKPLEKNRVKDYMEEDAELEIQGTDLNSIVNLLYRIDNSPVPLKVKSSTIRTTFEDPDKFILKLTVSLLSRA